jgi:hypothetical protein
VTDHRLRGRWASDLSKWMFATTRDVDTVGLRDDVLRLTRVVGGVEHVAGVRVGASLSDALERATVELRERVRLGAAASNGSG